jgi:hypothetical protein
MNAQPGLQLADGHPNTLPDFFEPVQENPGNGFFMVARCANYKTRVQCQGADVSFADGLVPASAAAGPNCDDTL